jgi:hypothetical protein
MIGKPPDALEVASKRRSFQLAVLPCNEDDVATNKVCRIRAAGGQSNSRTEAANY